MSTITMRGLGRSGRWGNQVFQYMFLRTYTKRFGLDYQCPRWIGQLLMGHRDSRITKNLERVRERKDKTTTNRPQELVATFPPDDTQPIEDKDYVGYCQYHTSYYQPDKLFARSLFVPTDQLLSRMQPVVDKLLDRGKTIVGMHMRRGDTGRLIFYLTPNDWYLKWLDEHWNTLDNPVLFIASENPSDREAFSKYNPVMSSDLLDLSNKPYPIYNYLKYDLGNPTPISMDWFPDWYLLTKCNVLVFGNSTFSYTAAMMASNLISAWRSRLSTQSFDLVDPWNDWPLIREDLRDYPGVANTWYDNNVQWTGGEVFNRP